MKILLLLVDCASTFLLLIFPMSTSRKFGVSPFDVLIPKILYSFETIPRPLDKMKLELTWASSLGLGNVICVVVRVAGVLFASEDSLLRICHINSADVCQLSVDSLPVCSALSSHRSWPIPQVFRLARGLVWQSLNEFTDFIQGSVPAVGRMALSDSLRFLTT
jgi:hypothetical protein